MTNKTRFPPFTHPVNAVTIYIVQFIAFDFAKNTVVSHSGPVRKPCVTFTKDLNFNNVKDGVLKILFESNVTSIKQFKTIIKKDVIRKPETLI